MEGICHRNRSVEMSTERARICSTSILESDQSPSLPIYLSTNPPTYSSAWKEACSAVGMALAADQQLLLRWREEAGLVSAIKEAPPQKVRLPPGPLLDTSTGLTLTLTTHMCSG